MASHELLRLTATEAVELMRHGKLKAEAYAQALLAQTQKQRHLNALIGQDTEQVLADAREADRKQARGESLGPLHGLPVLIKDNINTAALPTTAGTPALTQNVSARDAEVVSRLLRAGAILFGKANMHELSLGITSNNASYGAVRNPYDPTLISGGSSGGNAAALAARMVSAGLGADTAGSTRIPSALCGVVGFRPTHGRYPGTEAGATDFVPISHTYDTPGPMARCVADIAMLDQVMAGGLDPWQHLEQLRRQATPDAIRLGIARRNFFSNLDAEIEPVIEEALQRLRDHGITLVEVNIPNLRALVNECRAISIFESDADMKLYLKASKTGITLEQLADAATSPDVKRALRYMIDYPTSERKYDAALQTERPQLQQSFAKVFQKVDALVFPTTPLAARPIGEDDFVVCKERQVSTLEAYCSNVEPGAAAGLPCLSIPAGLTKRGLPVGLEIDGPGGSDDRLLAIGMVLERILGPHPAPPI